MDNTRRLNAGLPHGDGPWTCLRDEEANAYAVSRKRRGDAYYDFVAENGAMFHCPRLTMSTGGSWPGEPSVRPGPRHSHRSSCRMQLCKDVSTHCRQGGSGCLDHQPDQARSALGKAEIGACSPGPAAEPCADWVLGVPQDPEQNMFGAHLLLGQLVSRLASQLKCPVDEQCLADRKS